MIEIDFDNIEFWILIVDDDLGLIWVFDKEETNFDWIWELFNVVTVENDDWLFLNRITLSKSFINIESINYQSF